MSGPRRFRWTLLGGLALATLGLAGAARAEEDPVLVEAGDVKIRAARVWKIEKAWTKSLAAQDPKGSAIAPEARVTLRRQIALDELGSELIVQIAKEKKLGLSPDELKTQIEDFKKNLAPSGASLEEFLARRAWTQKEFEDRSMAQWAVEKQVAGGIAEADIKGLYEENLEELALRRCAHILFAYDGTARSTSKRTKDEARKLAEDTLAKLQTGKEDFAALAAKMSDDTTTREQGGDLPFSSRKGRSAMVPAFASALYQIPKVGEVSGVVESEFGYHIVKLTEVRELGFYKEGIKRVLIERKVDKLIEQAQGGREPKFNEELLRRGPPEGN